MSRTADMFKAYLHEAKYGDVHRAAMTDWSYPVTICAARYGGTYEGGRYVSFPLDADALPRGWDGDDTDALDYWHSDESKLVGRGETPTKAFADMLARHVKEANGY